MAPKKSNKNKKQGEQPARRSIDLEAANRDEAGTVVTGVEVLLSFLKFHFSKTSLKIT